MPIITLQYTHSPLPSTVDAQYRIRAFSADRGEGVFGIRNTFVAASAPSITAAPTIDSMTKSSVTISWSLNSDGGSPIFGFKLFRNDKVYGGQVMVYDGTFIPSVSSFLDLTINSSRYTYQALAINRVGVSSLSPESIEVFPS